MNYLEKTTDPMTTPTSNRLLTALGGGVLCLALAAFTAPTPVVAQEADEEIDIAFETELPRTLVFISERGDGRTAETELVSFLREAGFPLIDPAIAQTAAQRDLVEAALDGDEGAATELGRDFGAQVLILGRADWGARPDPVDGTLMTATSDLDVRALRLDRGEVIATGDGEGREADATEQRARVKAITEASNRMLADGRFVGQLINDWEVNSWREAAYWRPDPGSIQIQLDHTAYASDYRPEAPPSQPVQQLAQADAPPPGVAILLADVRPSTMGNTRGLGVVKKGDRSSGLFNPVRIEGVVVGETRAVTVDGTEAFTEPLGPDEAARLGLTGQQAQRFWIETNLPMSRDTVAVEVEGMNGSVSRAVAAPRIDERWAVVVGISEYASDDIPDLEYAATDAHAVRDFLMSDAAGPFEEDHILFLENEAATGSAMREAMFMFLQQADWDDLVVIYYAGHGAPDPNRPDNLYLLPHDADVNAMAATGFPMWDVKTALRRQISAERVVVIADACHSAGTTEDRESIAGLEQNAIAAGFGELFTPSRRLTITAADANEFSFEDERWGGHGVFTHYLLRGLEGEADFDEDGIVTFTETFDFVYANVREATSGRQNPQRSGLGDVPLAAVATAPAEEADRDRDRP